MTLTTLKSESTAKVAGHDTGSFAEIERAILVQVEFSADRQQDSLDELKLLASSAGVDVATVVRCRRQAPDSRYYVGSGIADHLAEQVESAELSVIIFNHNLSPAQTRNLEKRCQCRVIDRTSLILDIFSQRARSYEGKLQVELAQLKHLSSRLVRGWDNIERQKGGIGLRGPGETRLETDRRLLRQRVTALRQRLDKLTKQRQQGRQARQRAEIPVLALVGYTNAGKSSLFNRLTQANVHAADQLFATLDPTLRRIDIADYGPAVLADTVGFIRELPHDLVAAFKSTLQESQDADLVLLVVDYADSDHQSKLDQVQLVLTEIEADSVPQLLVWNKIDQCDLTARIDYDEQGVAQAVFVSAHSGDGIDLLQQAIRQRLSTDYVQLNLSLPSSAGEWRARLHQLKAVKQETFTEQGHALITISLSAADWGRLLQQSSGLLENYIVS
ncbi:ribosome rescue GTPase HflX [Alkalimonas collagenimarina]|uniref:GTPase HflX n=1 Tax=Alkalimonas collagenimarina TaxID=400390 RepID=A0ABT9GVK5_9GAMM|nr:ribosome rescue GTPase HflX [Alkalimonas collagenimarina]MDP4535083.1 ribosome rescue GTPase HflX [Alkalimonas collagenimarina]